MASQHDSFIRSLTSEDRLLLTLRDELYSGSWAHLKQDLMDRLNNRPYIFKLSTRIEDDLKRIEKMERYETEHKINISDFIGKEKE
ncbi:MAG: hypothetical protein ABIH42_01025 [Planctomycetota bacterium]